MTSGEGRFRHSNELTVVGFRLSRDSCTVFPWLVYDSWRSTLLNPPSGFGEMVCAVEQDQAIWGSLSTLENVRLNDEMVRHGRRKGNPGSLPWRKSVSGFQPWCFGHNAVSVRSGYLLISVFPGET